MLSAIRSSALPASRRAFSTASVARKHFMNASPEQFDAQAIKGDKVTIVDFYAECVLFLLPFRRFPLALTFPSSGFLQLVRTLQVPHARSAAPGVGGVGGRP